MSKHIPLISSGIAGPLGVLHLPRLWQKVSLEAVGKLHDDYPAIGAGYDSMVLDALGISHADFGDFVKAEKPSYPQCEAWVLEKCGGSMDSAKVDELNKSIVGYEHDDDTRGSIMALNNLPDEGKIRDAINLNNLEDWAEWHKAEVC
ncbi:MAG: DUF5069 domain-containing protein [Verrucomicrobiota bacterium]